MTKVWGAFIMRVNTVKLIAFVSLLLVVAPFRLLSVTENSLEKKGRKRRGDLLSRIVGTAAFFI